MSDFDEFEENENSAKEKPSFEPPAMKTVTPGFRLPGWVKLALIIAMIAISSVGYFTANNWFVRRPQLPTPAPESDAGDMAKRRPVADFILTDASNAQKKLSDFRGSVVILTFWASWCTPCLIELPTFAQLEKKYYDRGLRVLAVDLDDGNDGKDFAKDFWPKQGFKIPSFFDAGKTLAQKFEVEVLPSTFVIDRWGRLAFSGFGANDWNSEQTTTYIEGLLAETQESSSSAGSAAVDAKGNGLTEEDLENAPDILPDDGSSPEMPAAKKARH